MRLRYPQTPVMYTCPHCNRQGTQYEIIRDGHPVGGYCDACRRAFPLYERSLKTQTEPTDMSDDMKCVLAFVLGALAVVLVRSLPGVVL